MHYHLHFSFSTDVSAQKSCGLSPAVALLRRRLPPLEELRMDEEVATYTSVSVSAPSGFLPPRPRCGNPLATVLHFEELSVSTLLLLKKQVDVTEKLRSSTLCPRHATVFFAHQNTKELNREYNMVMISDSWSLTTGIL